jgi:hypothetical protein
MGNGFPIPPCPDPDRYVLVRTREGNFWRRKRGTGKKEATLNEAFRNNSRGMAITAPAAKRIVDQLRPFLDSVYAGRITVRISGLLRKQLNRSGTVGYTYVKNFDLLRDRPVDELLGVPVRVNCENDVLEVHIPVNANTITRNDSLVKGYSFELILLSGDCTVENDLRIESKVSDVFGINDVGEYRCSLRMDSPGKPWFTILKLCCLKGDEKKLCSENYGMKVVAVG